MRNCALSSVLANRAEGTPSTGSILFLNALKPSGICLMRCAQSRQEIRLRPAGAKGAYLLWFTKAAPAKDQPGRYQVAISDIKLTG